MWASEKAQTAAIITLLSPHPALAGLWTDKGPTRLACAFLEHGAPLSGGEMLLLKVAFDLWNGRGKATVADLLTTLDERNLRAVCDAILARDGEVARG
jgi:hypothetical protein